MRVILYTGKGGVGKTTIAAATAIALARAGHRVLAMSTDGAHSLGDSFGAALSGVPTPVAERLDAAEVDPSADGERAWSAIQRQLGRMLGSSGSVAAEEMVLFPGLSELFSLLAILDAVESERYDVVVVDCAPSGATLSLLRYPQQFTDFVTFALPIKRKLLRVVGPAVSRLTAFPVPEDSVFDEVEALTDWLGRLRMLLCDPDVSTLRIVTTPERVPVAEARRNHAWLHLYGYGVDAVVVNRILPEAALTGYFGNYRKIQAEALSVIEDGFAGLPVFTLELQPSEVVGLDGLSDLAGQAYGETDPAAVLTRERPFVVAPEGLGYSLSLSLPNAVKEELTLDQHGTDLVINLRGQRRVLALPDALAALEIAGATLADGHLTVRFA